MKIVKFDFVFDFYVLKTIGNYCFCQINCDL